MSEPKEEQGITQEQKKEESEPPKEVTIKPEAMEEKIEEKVEEKKEEKEPSPEEKPPLIFAVKTTANQERAVANLLEKRVKREKFDIRAILVPNELKGYILVETTMPEILEQAIANITHARSVVKGSSSFADVEHFLTPKPVVTGISEGAIIELIAGPFKGEKARVKRVDEAKEEITVELFEAMVPIPVTVRGDHVRILSKEETEHSLEKREKARR
ncbi:MAG: transcription elongation factor Spt5 [Methanocellales archaeon]